MDCQLIDLRNRFVLSLFEIVSHNVLRRMGIVGRQNAGEFLLQFLKTDEHAPDTSNLTPWFKYSQFGVKKSTLRKDESGHTRQEDCICPKMRCKTGKGRGHSAAKLPVNFETFHGRVRKRECSKGKIMTCLAWRKCARKRHQFATRVL